MKKLRCFEFAWLDGWIADLREATLSRLERERPGIGSDRLAVLGDVSADRDGEYTWVLIGGRVRFVVRERDGTILEAEDGRVNSRRSYGKLGEWERWDWSQYYPVQIEIWDYEQGVILHVNRIGGEAGREGGNHEAGPLAGSRGRRRAGSSRA